MIGLIVLVVGVLYLAFLVWSTRAAYRWAKGEGLSKTKCRLAAAGAFLVVYLPVFWDHIPTVLVHKYYCEKEAGFWVYKTVEQWKKENHGVAETLTNNRGQIRNSVGDMNNYTDTSIMNQRFLFIARHNGPFFINRWRRQQEISDAKNGEVLARYIDFSTSQERRQAGWSGWKFWLDSERCSSYSHMDSGSISTIANQIEGIGK